MPDYRLSDAAVRDSISIAQFGDEHFGVARSNQYRDKFKQRFSELAAHPNMYPAVDHIRDGYRRSVCGVHSIFYRIDDQDIEIVRVLGREDSDRAFD